MQTIHYGQFQFDTADAVASALLECGEALATNQRFDVVDVPSSSPDGTPVVHLLIGPGISLASIGRTEAETAAVAEWGSVSTRHESSPIERDEFGGPSLGPDQDLSVIDEMIVHRAVRRLNDIAARARSGIVEPLLEESGAPHDERDASRPLGSTTMGDDVDTAHSAEAGLSGPSQPGGAQAPAPRRAAGGTVTAIGDGPTSTRNRGRSETSGRAAVDESDA